MTETVARPQLSARYTATSGRVQLTGVQALARLPIDQHRRDLPPGDASGHSSPDTKNPRWPATTRNSAG